MKDQDFTKKIVIVVRKDLESWQVLNTVAHLSAYLGNKMRDRFDTGDYFITNDNAKYPRNSQFPIIIFAAKSGQIKGVLEKIRDSNLLYLDFIKEMIEVTDDERISEIIANKPDIEVEHLGIGVFGDSNQLKVLTKNFSLWK